MISKGHIRREAAKQQLRAVKSKRPIRHRIADWAVRINQRATIRYQNFLSRRPHRSFRRTYRRDYARSLRLPGYTAFNAEVWRIIWLHRNTFFLLVMLYTTMIVAIGAVTSQEAYTQINDLLRESSKAFLGEGLNKVGEAGLLAAVTLLSGPTGLSTDQQIYVGISLLFAWLCTVWLLREFLLNRRPRLRDGLYNSGAPVLATFIVLVVLVLQFVPMGLVALMYAGLASVGIISGGFSSMLFWLFTAAVAALSLYWATSTMIALVVVTLPGMYPMRALRISSDLVVGRRLRILYRWIWAILSVLLAWIVLMVPVILLDTAIKSTWPAIKDAPLVPYVAAFLSSCTVVWFAAYVYLLYRKIVDDDAKPA